MRRVALIVGLAASVGCQSTEADERFVEVDEKLAQAERQIIATTQGLKANSFGDGTYEVGADIQPGKYKTKGSTGEASCHWEFRNRQGNRTRNDLGKGPQVLVIPENVFAVVSGECGTWVRVGD